MEDSGHEFPDGTKTARQKRTDWFVKRLFYEQGEFENMKRSNLLTIVLQEVDKLHSMPGMPFLPGNGTEFFATVVRNLANQVSHMETNIIRDKS